MKEPRLKLAPPWITYVNKVQAMFGADPEIRIVYDNDEVELKIYVEDSAKADAMQRLLPYYKTFGNAELGIKIIPANNKIDLGTVTNKELFDIAFARNPVYAFSQEVVGILTNTLTYVVFKNKVVQFFNDNLDDIHGLVSTLYQDIADELFEESDLYGVFYNTDIEEKAGMPLGEWP